MISTVIRVIFVVLLGTIAGGVLAALGDMVFPDLIAGTMLGPNHPSTAVAWTIAGIVLIETLRRRFD